MSEPDFIIQEIGDWFIVSGSRYLYTDNASGRAIHQSVCYGSFRDQAQAEDLRATLQRYVDAAAEESAKRWAKHA